MKTLDIKQEYRALEELLSEYDPETGEMINSEDDLKDYIANLNDEKEKKLNNIEDLKAEKKGEIDTLKAKIEKLTKRVKSKESEIERLKDLQVYLLDGEKFKTDEYTFSFRKSKSVVIDGDFIELLPEEFIKITKTADKAKIKKAIESGDFVQGASIEEKTSLSVR